MVKRFTSSFGFTLIELLVVIAVISVVALVVYFGLNSNNGSQLLANTQSEFLVQVRALQNQVANGSDGVSVKSLIIPSGPSNCNATSCSYTIVSSYLGSTYKTATISLPAGVQFYSVGGVLYSNLTGPVAICFANPNLASFGSGQPCVTNVSLQRGCTSGSAFACNDGAPPTINSLSPFVITFNQGTVQKSVVFEGSGTNITRIYGQ